MKSLWLLEIRFTDSGGGLILRSLHKTREGAEKDLLTYCKTRWEQFEPEDQENPYYRGPLTIKKYFDLMDPDEVYEIAEIEATQ